MSLWPIRRAWTYAGELHTGSDVFIDCNVIFEGRVELADGVKIGPNVLIRNAVIKEQVEIFANSVIEDAVIGQAHASDPSPAFARRPNWRIMCISAILSRSKKSRVASGSKINHLSYVGDSVIGSQVNIGAGTITCNYDGANKHQTVIGDNAFIGPRHPVGGAGDGRSRRHRSAPAPPSPGIPRPTS